MRIFKKTDRILTLWQNNWLTPWIPLGVALGGLFIALYSGEDVKNIAPPLSGSRIKKLLIELQSSWK